MDHAPQPVLPSLAELGKDLLVFSPWDIAVSLLTLRLPPLPNALLLSALEGICLRSVHAFRLAHLQHHKHFPDKDDIEGADAAIGFWSALACGPLHQERCFAWA